MTESSIRVLGDTETAAFAVDQTGSIVEINARAATLLGPWTEQAVGRPCHDLLQGRAVDGEPICRPGCPYLTSVGGAPGASPVDMTVPDKRAGSPGRGLELAVHHVPLVLAGGPFMLHVLEDVRECRSLARVGARLKGLLGGSADTAWPLTAREAQAIGLVAQGLSSRQIAAQLRISPSTARNYIDRVLGKLGAPNRTAAVVRFLAAAQEAQRPRRQRTGGRIPSGPAGDPPALDPGSPVEAHTTSPGHALGMTPTRTAPS